MRRLGKAQGASDTTGTQQANHRAVMAVGLPPFPFTPSKPPWQGTFSEMAAKPSWEHVGLKAFQHQLPPSCPSHFPLPLLPPCW